MAKKGTNAKDASGKVSTPAPPPARGRPSALLDTRVVYCGDCLELLRNLPDACVDLVHIDPDPVSGAEKGNSWRHQRGVTGAPASGAFA